jgi:2-polyprenyl-3-methyl-5-hydroxy-6-metoxy-1,4-benzoquinol methylase
MKKFDKNWLDGYDARAKADIPEHEKLFQHREETEKQLRRVLSIVNSLHLKNARILDAGCGTGMYCIPLADRGYDVTGIDYSKGLLEIATKKSSSRKIRYDQGNLYNLPYKDRSFDIVLNLGVLQCVENHARVIEELARVTKKGGYVIISTLRQPRTEELPMIFAYCLAVKRWSLKKSLNIVRILRNRLYMSSNEKEPVANAKKYTPKEIKLLLKNNGIKVVRKISLGPAGIPQLSTWFMVIGRKL